MKNSSTTKKIFYTLIIVFILLLAYLFMPFPDSFKQPLFPVFGLLGFAFLVLGVILASISRKEKGKLKLFLMLTGISATAPLIFTILHNLFYALRIIFENYNYLFEVLHVSSFIISIIIAPLAFIVGVIGSIILFRRQK